MDDAQCKHPNPPFLRIKYFAIFHFQNLRDGLTPNIKRLQNLAQPQQLHVSESGVGLLQV